MRQRQQLKSYLPLALRQRLRKYAAKNGVSESSVTNAALSRYLDDTNEGPLILRKLHRIERNLERARRDTDVLSEAFAVFVQIWFAHTPRIEETEKPVAEQSALQRFSDYAEHVSEKVSAGESFVAELSREPATPAEDGSPARSNEEAS